MVSIKGIFITRGGGDAANYDFFLTKGRGAADFKRIQTRGRRVLFSFLFFDKGWLAAIICEQQRGGGVIS